MTTSPYIAVALFCERVTEDENGSKSFINTVDTLNFRPDDPSAEFDLSKTPIRWEGMLVIDIVFGEYSGEMTLEMARRHVESGKVERAMSQTYKTTDFPGMNSLSLSLNFTGAFPGTGTYWHDFYLNGEKKTQVPLLVRLVD